MDRDRRPPGLLLLAAIIGVGMGIPAFFRWKYFQLGRDRDRMLAAAPSQPEARLALWFEHGHPRILEALTLSRFSPEKPWIVSHLVAPPREGIAPEIWGVDVSGLEPDVAFVEGMDVRIVLPAPRLLDHDVLVGDNALGVAVYPRPGPSDARMLVRDRVEYALKRMIEALPRDIPGARISVEVAGLVRPRPPGR